MGKLLLLQVLYEGYVAVLIQRISLKIIMVFLSIKYNFLKVNVIKIDFSNYNEFIGVILY